MFLVYRFPTLEMRTADNQFVFFCFILIDKFAIISIRVVIVNIFTYKKA